MRRTLLLAALAVSPCLVHAQSVGLGTTFRAGYTFSGHFTGNNGSSGNMAGLELGADLPLGPQIPIGPLEKLKIFLSPSVFFGTMNGGNNPQGTVYRALVMGQAPLGTSGLYGRFGVGYAYASANNSSFNSGSAYEIQYALGMPILKNTPALHINAEIGYHQSSRAAVSGWTFGISASF